MTYSHGINKSALTILWEFYHFMQMHKARPNHDVECTNNFLKNFILNLISMESNNLSI